MSDLIDRARKYIAKCPPAITGQGGHNKTFWVACQLVNGYAFDEEVAYQLLEEYNRTSCSPAWSEKELRHKIKEAIQKQHDKPRGYLIGSAGNVTHVFNSPVSSQKNRVEFLTKTEVPSPSKEAKEYDIAASSKLPDPIPDSARVLIKTLFKQGEGIRIVQAKLNADEKEIPDGSGPTLLREQWIKRLDDRDGNPNKIWKSSDKTGVYIAVNPLKPGGNRDDDVTCYRHCLVEFDELKIEEQWALIQQSNIPVAALIHSGGRSLHAWVPVDAKDANEYKQRVGILYDHFKAYGIDDKNKNPSRLSRLPNCERFGSRQELLAVNIGAPSFLDWLANKEVSEIGHEISIDSLLSFVASEDPNCVLGNRWLCRGGSCLFIGQSGIGKSSLAMQAAMHWALSRPLYGITPKRALRSLFIQAENDAGDMAEMFQGVWAGLGLDKGSKATLAEVKDKIKIQRLTTHTGKRFCDAAQRLIDKYKPDLVWVDPLLAYIGDDISKQVVVSQFLREWLNPISEASGIIWMLMHHTNKPPIEPGKKQEKTKSDLSYMGAGSADLVNWARAVNYLYQVEPKIYSLALTKRGARAGAITLGGSPTDTIYLRHSEKGIYWEQVDSPEAESNFSIAKKETEEDKLKRIAKIIVQPMAYSQIVSILCAEFDRSKRTVEGKGGQWSKLKPFLMQDNEASGEWFCPPNVLRDLEAA